MLYLILIQITEDTELDNSYNTDWAKYEYIKEHQRSTALDCAYYVVEVQNMATGQTISSEKIYAASAELELEPGEYICQVMAYNSSGSPVDSSRKNYVNTCMSEDKIYADPLCKIYPKEQYSWGVYRLLGFQWFRHFY